jgi:hypothetical protein
MTDNTSAHLRQILAPRPQEGTAEEDNGLPDLQGTGYLPHARPAAKAVFALHVIFPNGTVQSFQYQHLDSASRYLNESIELRFLGARITQVVLRGRNLWKLYDYLHQHRITWLRVADRDLAHDGETIITGVFIEEPQTSGIDAAMAASVPARASCGNELD